ncbi:hypothetical protein L6R52_37465 [Myxococcota bacterium]|nr:hypothetical protein [Myxococcota bacterium]
MPIRTNTNEPINTPRPNEPERVNRRTTARLDLPTFTNAAASNPFTGLSVEAALFEALQLQKSGAEQDLLGIVDDLRANNAKKAELRKMQGILRQMEAIAGHKDKKPSDADAARMTELRAELDRLMGAAGFGEDSALAKLTGGMPNTGETSKEDVAKWFGQVKDELDALAQNYSDMGEENNIQLQLALSKKSQFETAMSNSMKSIDETAKGIVRNIG